MRRAKEVFPLRRGDAPYQRKKRYEQGAWETKSRKISHVVILGDSLSDRGTMDRRYLFGFIPMAGVSGLKGKSPDGRFTNHYAWSDHLGGIFANKFIIGDIKKKTGADTADIADGIIDEDPTIKPLIEDIYSFDQDQKIDFKGRNLVRSYAEGGLTAHDYSWSLSNSLSRFFSRIILSKLADKRQMLFKDDEEHALSYQHKAETLVFEWSGANDLITVNREPSHDEADRAIAARIENVREMMKHGYRHFMLFNLPDLALTPRYQAKSAEEQRNAHDCSLYFNTQLAKACQALQKSYPYCSIGVFDVCELFSEVYEHPEKYHFDKAKLTKPYTTSPDFKIRPDGTSPSHGYMFYDDVHPTADLHVLLGERLYDKIKLQYDFKEPEIEPIESKPLNINDDELLASFREAYRELLGRDRNGFFGSWRQSRINFDKASLEEILEHALFSGGQRSFAVMQSLHWFDSKGNLNLNIPVLIDALDRVETAHAEKENAPAAHGAKS